MSPRTPSGCVMRVAVQDVRCGDRVAISGVWRRVAVEEAPFHSVSATSGDPRGVLVLRNGQSIEVLWGSLVTIWRVS